MPESERGKMNCIGTFWKDDEIAVISDLCRRQELSPEAILRQGLRLYQMHVLGVPQLGEKALPQNEHEQLDKLFRPLARKIVREMWMLKGNTDQEEEHVEAILRSAMKDLANPKEPTLTCSEVVERLATECMPPIGIRGNISAFDREQATAILHSWRERRVQEIEEQITKHSGSPQTTDSASGDKSSSMAKETRSQPKMSECPHCHKYMGFMNHGVCEKCKRYCGCSFDPTSKNDYCKFHAEAI